jgi:Protein of unknown function (DUF1580)
MSIDLRNEQTLSLSGAAKMLPPGRRGRPVNLSTIFRWIFDGIKGSDGVTIRLEAIKLGARWLTSVEALERFAEAQTPRFGEDQHQEIRTPSARKRASDQAAKALARLGIK